MNYISKSLKPFSERYTSHDMIKTYRSELVAEKAQKNTTNCCKLNLNSKSENKVHVNTFTGKCTWICSNAYITSDYYFSVNEKVNYSFLLTLQTLELEKNDFRTLSFFFFNKVYYLNESNYANLCRQVKQFMDCIWMPMNVGFQIQVYIHCLLILCWPCNLSEVCRCQRRPKSLMTFMNSN